MPLKKQNPLSAEIGLLVTALGNNPPISSGQIKSGLMALVASAENLEHGHGAAELNEQIAALEKQIEDFEAMRKTQLEELKLENANLQLLLKEARAEADRFRAEQKEREEKERYPNLEDAQLLILRALEPESIQPQSIFGLRQKGVGTPDDEVAWHLAQLKELRCADCRTINLNSRRQTEVWFRTAFGNALVIAKRLAGEEEVMPPKGNKKPKKYADLPELEQEILALLKSSKDGIGEETISAKMHRLHPKVSAAKTRHHLESLKEEGMIDSNEDAVAIFSCSTPGEEATDEVDWFIKTAGRKYLDERGLL